MNPDLGLLAIDIDKALSMCARSESCQTSGGRREPDSSQKQTVILANSATALPPRSGQLFLAKFETKRSPIGRLTGFSIKSYGTCFLGRDMVPSTILGLPPRGET